jgi:hypothetical protein
MAVTSPQLQALEATVLKLPETEKLWLLDILLTQLHNLPESIEARLEDLEDAGLYQAMLATQHETPLSREAAIAELNRP